MSTLFNQSADHLYYVIGVNSIPANTKNKIASTVSTSTPLIKNNYDAISPVISNDYSNSIGSEFRSLTEPKGTFDMICHTSLPKQKMQYPHLKGLGQNRGGGYCIIFV